MEEINQETRPFVEFYKDVTTRIEGHIVTKGLNPQESDFIRFLCCGFWWEYVEWKHAPFSSFLQRAHGHAIKPLVVVCMAFFHMAYDLPRVIANSLVANPGIDLDVLVARNSFFDMDYLFEPALKAQFRNPKSVGFFARVAKLFPGDTLSLHGIAANWVLNIRARSFHHGEILTRAQAVSKQDRSRIEATLETAVIATMDEALKRKRNPASWLSILRSPSIKCFALPALLFLLAPIFNRWTWSHLGLPWKVAIGGGAVLGSMASYVFAAYVGLLRLMARVGSLVADTAERVMREADLEYSEKTVE